MPFFGATLIVFLTISVYHNIRRLRAAGMALLAAFLCFFIIKIDKFEYVAANLYGFEARTRKADELVKEAKASLESLRDLAAMAGGFQVENLAAEGRIGGRGTAAQNETQKEQILKQLRALGLSESKLKEVALADQKWVSIDYAFGILGKLNNPDDPLQRADYDLVFASGNPPLPRDCEMILNKFQINDEWTRNLLEDYKYYVRLGHHRRPEVWLDHDSWWSRK